MPPRKRGRQEMEADEEVTTEPSVLDRLRNMWEFASLMQYIFLFGKAVKIDEDFDIDVRHLTSPSGGNIHPLVLRHMADTN